MKKHALTIFFSIIYLSLLSQNISLIFVPANSSDIIDSIIVKEVATGDTLKLNGSSFNWDATKGLLYHFEVHSGDNVTVIADTPKESKDYNVEFYRCQDKDGRNYKIVQIGDQWWMAENLTYLPKVFSPNDLSRFEPRYYVYGYKDTITSIAKNSESYTKYGVLYNWESAIISCPEGWHLPSNEEWNQLTVVISKSMGPFDKIQNEWHNVGKYLKSSQGWIYEGNGTDDFAFTALPSGFLWAETNDFWSKGYGCRFWGEGGTRTTTDMNLQETYYYNLYYYFDILFENQSYRDGGYSVRAIKN